MVLIMKVCWETFRVTLGLIGKSSVPFAGTCKMDDCHRRISPSFNVRRPYLSYQAFSTTQVMS